MNLIDLNALTAKPLAAPQLATGTITSPSLDLKDFLGVLKLVQEVGTVTGTAPTLDGKLQDSADNATFADVAGLTFAQVTASTSSQSLQVDTRAVRRYIRYIGTIGGTTPGFSVAVEAVGAKRNL